MAAAAIVLGVIALVVVLSAGKDDEPRPSAPPPEVAGTRPTPETPAAPERPPPPDLPPTLLEEARQLLPQYEELAAQAKAVYGEALRAHEAGDDDLWQEKLGEAALLYGEIKDGWNDLIWRIPTTTAWDDPDEIANYHMGREQEKISRLLRPLKDIEKQRNIGNDGGN
ncbi:MAG: hypothetical protein ACYTG6_01485 [Planctomycetota bacterium]